MEDDQSRTDGSTSAVQPGRMAATVAPLSHMRPLASATICAASPTLRRQCVVPRASGQQQEPTSKSAPASETSSTEKESQQGSRRRAQKPVVNGVDGKQVEASLELLEARVKGKREGIQKARRQIPILGMNDVKQDNSNMAPWNEGQLFPDGWESMPLPQKLYELYVGRRGVLFWASKAAYASVFILIGAWVVFRFVGPALGLYKLAGDIMPPPL